MLENPPLKHLKDKKIFVIGSQGQLGQQLAHQLEPLGSNVEFFDRDSWDLADLELSKSKLTAGEPDLVINAAAYTNVGKAEEDPMAFTINGEALRPFAEWSKTTKNLLVHFSTDYVFDGKKTTSYTEQDTCGPLNAYGQSKLQGERIIQEQAGPFFIFRTSWVFSEKGQNFLLKIIELAKKLDHLKIVDDQVGSPTYARDLAYYSLVAIDGFYASKSSGGLFHLSNSGSCSWHGFASYFLEKARELDSIQVENIEPVDSSHYPEVDRPQNSQLNCERFTKTFNLEIRDWKQATADCLGRLYGHQ